MEDKTELFRTVYQGGVGEITLKKSRFIATVCPVETEEAAIEFIEMSKKKYWDAAHNCSAYIIGTRNPVMRCSDDGEPAKTAGWPILDVLTSHKLTNIIVVVTRYFGGTLLGTGGLVKAYQSATKEGLSQSTIITKELGSNLLLTTDYNYIGKIQYLIGQESYPILKTDYTDHVQMNVLVPPKQFQAFQRKLDEVTNGTVDVKEIEQVYFANIHNEIHLFR